MAIMNAMNAMDWNIKQQCLDSTFSLTDVRKKLFPTSKLDRAPVLSENKYTPKTLVGNWFERRASDIKQPDDWRTLYELDYKLHVNKTWKINQIAKWENKLVQEGLPLEQFFDHKMEYHSNMTTTYDLCYNILPKDLKEPNVRFYNARQRKWVPEQDLTKSFGTLTQFGLKDAIKEELYKNSEEGIAKCRWSSTYREEIGKLQPLNIERNTQFHRRKVNFNVPDITRFELPSLNTSPSMKIKNSMSYKRYIGKK